MANFNNMVLTQAGLALYTKAQTGVQLNFTRMQIGSGQLAAGQDQTKLTALISPVSFFSINSVTSSNSTATVKGIFENTNITSASYVCELGLFAQDPTAGEVLYAYANAGTQGDTIPPISAGPFNSQYQISAALGNASSVTATIPANTYVPVTDKGVANGVATLDNTAHIPAAQLPIATAGAIGGVKQGANITIAQDGTISGAAPYSLTNATATQIGGVQIPSATTSAAVPVAATRVANAKDVLVNTTAAQTLASYTPPVAGEFVIYVNLRALAAVNTQVQVTYNDSTGTAQTDVIWPTAQVPAGPSRFIPCSIYAGTGAPISVSITAATANQIYASASIVGV